MKVKVNIRSKDKKEINLGWWKHRSWVTEEVRLYLQCLGGELKIELVREHTRDLQGNIQRNMERLLEVTLEWNLEGN